jgi:hypothetical protein
VEALKHSEGLEPTVRRAVSAISGAPNQRVSITSRGSFPILGHDASNSCCPESKGWIVASLLLVVAAQLYTVAAEQIDCTSRARILFSITRSAPKSYLVMLFLRAMVIHYEKSSKL